VSGKGAHLPTQGGGRREGGWECAPMGDRYGGTRAVVGGRVLRKLQEGRCVGGKLTYPTFLASCITRGSGGAGKGRVGG
jgi:hypothetical protein